MVWRKAAEEALRRSLRIAVVGNGASIHTILRTQAIAELGHSVRLVTVGATLPSQGIEVRTRPLPRSPLDGLRAFGSFQKDLRDFAPDLLHVHYAGGRLGSLALASGIKPLVVTVMGGDVQPEQHPGGPHWFDQRTTARLLEEADLLVTKSEALRSYIAHYGDYASKTEIVRWGIDPARFVRDPARGEDLRRRLGLPQGPLLLSPRILRPLYNTHLIVEAMPQILDRCPQACLLISRHGEDAAYAQRVRERAGALGVTASLRFLDPLDHDVMPDLLSITRVAVSVPFADGLPQTLFECLASQTPLVLGRLPAYEEIVQHEREVLFTDLAAPAIAAAVLRLLLEPGLARRLSAAGLARIREQASLPEEARRVAGFYRRVLAGRPRPSPLGPRLLDAVSLGFRRG